MCVCVCVCVRVRVRVRVGVRVGVRVCVRVCVFLHVPNWLFCQFIISKQTFHAYNETLSMCTYPNQSVRKHSRNLLSS